MQRHIGGLRTIVSLMLILGASNVAAQTIGTFRWQFAPYCNTVTLLVEQKAGAYVLTGADDLCGGPVRAPATGTAHMNPNGTVTLSVSVIRPDGIPVAHSAQLDFPALSGTWADNYGNSGDVSVQPRKPEWPTSSGDEEGELRNRLRQSLRSVGVG